MRTRTLALAIALALGCARAAPAPAAPRPGTLALSLAWATYWGPPGGANLRTAVFDAAGNLYVAGGTEHGPEFPKTAPLIGQAGISDVVVAKFDPSGKNLWSIVIAGPGEDYAYVSSLDGTGNLVVGGRAGPGFPVTPGAFATKFAGGFVQGPHGATDGFLLSLTPDGALRWASYVGTSGDDIVRSIDVLPDGTIAFAGGAIEHGDLPVTPGVVKPKMGGGKDSLLGRISADGAHMIFLSYFGPSDDSALHEDETIRALAHDAAGNLWLGGTTQGTDLTPTTDAFQPERRGGGTAYVARLSADGRAISYFSWLGGSGEDDVETEGCTDAAGNFVIAGGTNSADFPTTPGAVASGGSDDCWVARVRPDGKLGTASRLGGSGRDHCFGPAPDAAGNLFVAGSTESRDFPVTAGAPQTAYGAGWDAFLAAVDAKGALAFATYYGGSGDETGRFAATDPARGRVALVGETTSQDLALRGAAQASPGGLYVAVFQEAPAAVDAVAPPAPSADRPPADRAAAPPAPVRPAQ